MADKPGLSARTYAQIALIVSVSTLLAAVSDESRRAAWVAATVVSHVILLLLGVYLVRARRD